MEKSIGEPNCPNQIQAGSYYEPLPWVECRKLPYRVSNDHQMCDLDAGKDCRFAPAPSLEIKGGANGG